MQANELRIGNQIYINNRLHTLMSADIFTISQHELFGQESASCNPVKLTEDMLFKTGFKFEYEKVTDRFYSNGDFFLQWNKQEGFHFADQGKIFGKGFFYWHQLQNLYFDLTGKNLSL